MDLAKYAELFLTEGREHVAELHAALAVLEQPDTLPHHTAQAVAAAFRAVHSVKGMAAAMSYATVTELAHALETRLDGVRNGDEPVTPPLVAHLLDEVDTLARAIETARDDGASHPGEAPDTAVPPPSTATTAVLPSPSTMAPRDEAPRDGHRPTPRPRSIRVDASRLDALMTLVGELEIARGRLDREVHGGAAEAVEQAAAQLSRLVAELREQIVTARMVPVGQIFERFPPLVRETARFLEKAVDFVMEGMEIELDRSMLDRIGDPVMHLLRNALDHGIEPVADRIELGKPPRGRLTLSAQRDSGVVLLRVTDDGRGIDRERVALRARAAGLWDGEGAAMSDADLVRVLTHPGFSTAERVTDISGRGVGLDVVDATMRAFGGELELHSVAGEGTSITLCLPLTIAIVPALLARVGEETYAVPLTHVLETVEITPDAVRGGTRHGGRLSAVIRDETVSIVSLRETLGLPPRDVAFPKAVTVDVRGQRAALVVDDFVGKQDIVVKRFDAVRGAPSWFSGATILGDGAPALIFDLNSLV